MKMKEKILLKAIELFNAQGIPSTSPNQIAAALNVSVGNLTYHFRTKEILVTEVYERMDGESKDIMKLDGYLTLDSYRKIMKEFRDFMNNYPFFFQDLVYITRNFPEVAKLYEAANLNRFKKGRILFNYYIETGRMVPEKDGINYDLLIHNVWMIGAFWNIQNKIINPNAVFDKPMDLLEMNWYMILPYLTEKGKEEYDQINAFLNSQEIKELNE